MTVKFLILCSLIAVPRRGTRMCHPGGGLTAERGRPFSSEPPPQRNPHINSVRATVPAMPAGQPSMVVLTTADPPISKLEPHAHPLTPQNTVEDYVCVFLHLHSSSTGLPGSPNPHPSHPYRPPRW